jgi:hypothetical protein
MVQQTYLLVVKGGENMIPRLYDEYNESVRIEWRKGTAEDPYIDMLEHHKIINNKIVLSEIPVEFHRVVINGFSEIDQRKPAAKKIPDVQEYIVNYSNGIVTFHPSQEGKTVVTKYKGRGFIQYPASRIWAHYPNPDAVMNLQEIIEISHKRIEEVEIAIDEVIRATNNANIAAEGAIIATQKANQAADSAASAANTAIDASKNANDMADYAYQAALTTRLIWLDPVETYADIAVTYPNPEIGSTTMVKQTGSRYRYEGNGIWREIDNYTRGSIPLASPTVNGLMSSDDYILTHDKLKYRAFGFALPTITSMGIQKLIIQFPFDGVITDVVAICNKPCATVPTNLYIERISKNDFGQQVPWEKIHSSPISFGVNEYSAIIPNIDKQNITSGDIFRLNVEGFDPSQEGIAIQIFVQL